LDKYNLKLYDKFALEIEHFKNTICPGTCFICGEDLAGKDEVFIVRCDLFPEATVHKGCCHQRLIEEVDEQGLVVLGLHLESEWNRARKYGVWFKQ